MPSEPDAKTVAQNPSSQTHTLFAVVRNNFHFLSSQHFADVVELSLDFLEETEVVVASIFALVRRDRRRGALTSLSRLFTIFRAVGGAGG